MIKNLKLNIANIPGWRTNEKIIVFESDDWGAIRMPSKQVYDKLLVKGIRVDKSYFDSLDALERKEDLIVLFDLLQSFDRKNRDTIPKFTFNTVVGNPVFEKIKNSDFEKYEFELFINSYKRYYGENNFQVWKDGIESNVITPQFHAREHLNVQLWLKDLKLGKKVTREAFDLGFYGLKTKTSSNEQRHYLAAYHVTSRKELNRVIQICKNGLNLFVKLFGFGSTSFIACNYVWPRELERAIKEDGVKFIQGQRGQIQPGTSKSKKKILYHYVGQKNLWNQRYLVRNVTFEPYLNQDVDWVDKALSQIKTSFFWKKPAVISTHRINYVSHLSKNNRDLSLNKLKLLIKKIIKLWPDVQFLSSNELGAKLERNDSHP